MSHLAGRVCIECGGPPARGWHAYCEACVVKFQRRHAAWAAIASGVPQAVAVERPPGTGRSICLWDAEDEPHSTSWRMGLAERMSIGFYLLRDSG